MPGSTPANSLTVTNQVGGQVTLMWNPAPEVAQADVVFLDIATENGFVNYVVQDNLNPPSKNTGTYNLPPGTYWARVNTHYPGYGVPEFNPLDRGWFPSQHIPVTVDPAPPLPTGLPASNIVWTAATHRLSWTPGHGDQPITRVSVDLSTNPNFFDILASPFVPTATCQGTLVGYPFAFDVPQSCNTLDILGSLVPDFYVRVNTLFGNRAWYPSAVKHIVNGVDTGGSGGISPLLLVGLGAGAVYAFMAYQNKNKPATGNGNGR